MQGVRGTTGENTANGCRVHGAIGSRLILATAIVWEYFKHDPCSLARFRGLVSSWLGYDAKAGTTCLFLSIYDI